MVLLHKVLTIPVALACFQASLAAQPAEPLEEVMAPSTNLTFVAMPFIGLFQPTAPLPWHDNFAAAVDFEHIFPVGPDWSLHSTYGHAVQQTPIPVSGVLTGKSVGLVSDMMSVGFSSRAYHYFRADGKYQYNQSRSIDGAAVAQGYDFDHHKATLELSYDRRFSTLETWIGGRAFQYPDSGILVSLGSTLNRGIDSSSGKVSTYATVGARSQSFLSVNDTTVLAATGEVETTVGATVPEAYKSTSSALGGYRYAGDYHANVSLEIRLLALQGVFWETPEVLYISSYSIKSSPGLALGWSACAVGDTGLSPLFLQSAYLSPMIAIRMNGQLQVVVRTDLSISFSPTGAVIYGISLGTVNSGTAPIYRTSP